MIDREELERLHEAATPGPWDIDSEYDEDGLYSGGGGCGRGFKNFFIGAEINGTWRTLLDTQNSDNKLIEEEYDEDSINAWDAIGMANAELITYLRNAVPDILALATDLNRANEIITEKEAEIARLRGVVAVADDAIREMFRYYDGGEMRGSYDGKPERAQLRKAGYATSAALKEPRP